MYVLLKMIKFIFRGVLCIYFLHSEAFIVYRFHLFDSVVAGDIPCAVQYWSAEAATAAEPHHVQRAHPCPAGGRLRRGEVPGYRDSRAALTGTGRARGQDPGTSPHSYLLWF